MLIISFLICLIFFLTNTMLVLSYLITLFSCIHCTYHYFNTFSWNLNILLIIYGILSRTYCIFIYNYKFYESAKLYNGQSYCKLSVLYLWLVLYLFSILLLSVYSNNKYNFITTTYIYNHISNTFTINFILYNDIYQQIYTLYHSNIYYSISKFDSYRYYIHNLVEYWLYILLIVSFIFIIIYIFLYSMQDQMIILYILFLFCISSFVTMSNLCLFANSIIIAQKSSHQLTIFSFILAQKSWHQLIFTLTLTPNTLKFIFYHQIIYILCIMISDNYCIQY